MVSGTERLRSLYQLKVSVFQVPRVRVSVRVCLKAYYRMISNQPNQLTTGTKI